MAVAISAMTLFMAFCVVYQWLVAAILLRERPWGAVRALSAALLVLNGGVAFGFVLLSAGFDSRWGDRAITIFDDPTGILVVLLATALLRPDPLKRAVWPRGLATATLAVVALASTDAALRFSGHEPWEGARLVGVVLPVAIGYAMVLWVTLRRFLHSTDAASAQVHALLAIGFGMRAVEFAWFYGVTPWRRHLEGLTSGPSPLGLNALAHLLMLAGVVACLAYFASRWRRAEPPVRPWRLPVAAGLLGGLLVGVAYSNQTIQPASPWYALSAVTLLLVRPVFCGLALEWDRTLRWTGILGLGFGIGLGWKLLLSTVLAQPFFELSPLDAFPAGLTAASLPLALLVLRRRHAASGPFLSRGPPQEATHAHRLARFLLAQQAAAPTHRGVTQADIRQALGIATKNVAGEIRRVERLLAADAEASSGRVVEVQSLGVRGRKYYRLTPEGVAAAQRLPANFEAFQRPETP